MGKYYVLYPKKTTDKPKIKKGIPTKSDKRRYGFSEGSFNTKKSAQYRLKTLGYSKSEIEWNSKSIKRSRRKLKL